uniref:NADH-ubiquinone oxidoreductase chain 3 n=1 Tax=Chrysolagria sp. CHR01 TaxID=1205615 RepID=A0A0S2MPD4_9CUCU|nr:NADH deshydrogenase subunit 3 [Chrysolagria sp. CHR01]
MMKLMMTLFMIITFLILVLTLILNVISKKSFSDREKSSPFECGFDPKSSSRLPFSLHFFLIAIIFLVFDVEITILFPMIISMKMSNMFWYLFLNFFFIMILILGILHEWNEGSLNWK